MDLHSVNSQISCIFKHPRKKDLYIVLADRWMGPMSRPEFESGAAARLVQSAFAKKLASPPQPLNPDETAAFKYGGFLKVNTSEARYVWLPLRFEGERPVIEWRLSGRSMSLPNIEPSRIARRVHA